MGEKRAMRVTEFWQKMGIWPKCICGAEGAWNDHPMYKYEVNYAHFASVAYCSHCGYMVFVSQIVMAMYEKGAEG